MPNILSCTRTVLAMEKITRYENRLRDFNAQFHHMYMYVLW